MNDDGQRAFFCTSRLHATRMQREGERASSGKEENAGIEGEAIGGSYSTGRKGL